MTHAQTPVLDTRYAPLRMLAYRPRRSTPTETEACLLLVFIADDASPAVYVVLIAHALGRRDLRRLPSSG